MKTWLNNVGPGVLVSAAFIGPGTVTVCSVTGASFGYSLLWALGLSVVFCIGLQEMAARLGVVTQAGLSEAVRKEISQPILRNLSLVLIFSAIVLGNAAYEAGNISGAALGLHAVLAEHSATEAFQDYHLLSFLIGGFSFALLFFGTYKVLEKVFIFLVLLMSLSFFAAAIVTQPEYNLIVQGLFVPDNASAGLLSVMSIIGTTVVPYNLFLHASLVSSKWDVRSLNIARKELLWAILVGGAISMAIMITAAASGLAEIKTAGDLAVGLEPVFGIKAKLFLGIGLFAAGITSAITAPLAAAYVVSGCLGWGSDITSLRFKAVWAVILVLGVIFSSLGYRPIEIIQVAQFANALLLPIIAGFLLWMVNRQSLMGTYVNRTWQNICGLLIVGTAVFLGIKSVYSLL